MNFRSRAVVGSAIVVQQLREHVEGVGPSLFVGVTRDLVVGNTLVHEGYVRLRAATDELDGHTLVRRLVAHRRVPVHRVHKPPVGDDLFVGPLEGERGLSGLRRRNPVVPTDAEVDVGLYVVADGAPRPLLELSSVGPRAEHAVGRGVECPLDAEHGCGQRLGHG